MIPWPSTTINFPFSGNVKQDISPETDWFSQTIPAHTGSSDIERAVMQEVASYGEQIKVLTVALLHVIEKQGEKGKPAPEVVALQNLNKEIEALKIRLSLPKENQAKAILDTLSKENPDALKDIIAEYSGS